MPSCYAPTPSLARAATQRQRADQIAAFVRKHGHYPRLKGRSVPTAERRLSAALYHMRRSERWDLLDPRGISRAPDRAAIRRQALARTTPEERSAAGRRGAAKRSPEERSAAARRAARARSEGCEQFASLADLIPRFCRCWRPTVETPSVEGDSGWALNAALRRAGRGLGGDDTPEGRARALRDLVQVKSISRACAEVEADCWQLTLRGAGAPDPRPWAKLLAAGDHVRAARAERVAYLDWQAEGGPRRRGFANVADPFRLSGA